MFSIAKLRESIALAATKADARLRQAEMQLDAAMHQSPAGASRFIAQHTNPEKNQWRKLKRQIGARQARHHKLTERMAAKMEATADRVLEAA